VFTRSSTVTHYRFEFAYLAANPPYTVLYIYDPLVKTILDVLEFVRAGIVCVELLQLEQQIPE